MWLSRTRDRLLIRHFLWRFIEHDLVSPHTDRRSVLSATGGFLMAVSLLLGFMTATPYVFSNSIPPGMTSVYWLADHVLFISSSMLVAALAATAQWNALVLEPRDAAILGPLPLSRSLLVRTRFAATGVFALAVILAWNIPHTLTRLVTVPLDLHVGVAGTLWVAVAHGVSATAAGAFGFLAIVFVREALCAILGHERFGRVSGALQAVLIIALTTMMLLLPGTYYNVGRKWLSTAGVAEKVVPALWFVGLNETMSGSVVDGLPHPMPRDRWVRVPEERATALYRSLGPTFQLQARTSLVALLVVACGAAGAALWNSRRLPLATRAAARNGAIRGAIGWLGERVLARSALSQAGFFFTLQTLSRRVTHRVSLATALAVGIALVAVSSSDGLFAAQFFLLGTALGGFRHATNLPADLKGSLTFSIAWSGRRGPYEDGVRRAGWIIAAPLLAVVALWNTALIGPIAAALQCGVGIAYVHACLHALFFRNRLLPLASAYVPSEDAKLQFVKNSTALLTTSLGLGALERVCLGSPARYVMLLIALFAIGLAAAWLDRHTGGDMVTVDLDASTALPTQRLGLT